MIKTKEEMMEEYYQHEVEFLKEIASKHAIKEEELFPSPYEGYTMNKYDLSICLIEGIRLKGKRWIKAHKTTDDINVIKESLWQERISLSDGTPLFHLYGDIDDEWYNILNGMLKDKYGVWFISNEELMQKTIDNAHAQSDKISDILLLCAESIHRGIKRGDIKWLEAIDKTEESWIGQNNY